MVNRTFSLFPPTSLLDVFRPLAKVDVENFQQFLTEIGSRQAFNSDKKRCEKLGYLIGVAPEDVGLLLSLLAGIYKKFRTLEDGGADFDSLSKEFYDEALSDDDDDSVKLTEDERVTLTERLRSLLRKNDTIDNAEKIARLKAGFIKNATGFSSFVDIRPNFKKENTEVQSLILLAQLRISTDSDNPIEREFIFQCDEKALKKLKEVISAAEKKFLTLSNHSSISKFLEERDEV